jgi:glutathione S-transferase
MVRLADEDVRTREVTAWTGIHVLHHPVSSCSQKLRIFLNLKGIPWHSRVIDLAANANMSEWFLGINPRGLVPVLIHDGAVHIESNDILLHLERSFPDPSLIPASFAAQIVNLLRHEDDLHMDLRALSFRFVFDPPTSPKSPEVLERFVKSGSGKINGELDAGKAEQVDFWSNYASRGVTDETVRAAVAHFRVAFDELEQRLGHDDFLLGTGLSVLDIAWFIYANRLVLAGYPLRRLHRALAAWFDRLKERPEFACEVALPVDFLAHVERTQRRHAEEGRTLVDIGGLA